MARLLILALAAATLLSSTSATLEWPPDRALPFFPDVASSIDAADLTRLTGEEQTLLTSLQGIVNRNQPRLYLYWNDNDGINKAWLEGIRKYVNVTDWSGTPWQLLEKYRLEIKGAVAYDMDVPDTINLATTYAGYRDCVIASPSLAKAHKLQVVQNLEGIFKTKQDVYSYGLKNIYPKLTKRLVAAIAPKAGETEVNAIFRDYIVATAAPCVWLDPDNPDELPLLRQILDTLNPNSAYMGWFPYGHEMNGVTEASQKSLYVVASDFLYNGSLMSGLKKFFPVSATSAPAAPVRRIENKMYVSLTWSEGDNVQYCQRRLRQLWDDRLRGKLPMGWTITPLLADVAPNILNYLQTTATANDTFVVGPSGAGYTNPISWPLGNLEKFLNQTKRYSQETGIGSTMWVYNRVDGKPQPISTGISSAYKSQLSPKLLGIAVDVGDQAENASAVENIDGLAVVGLLQMDSLETGFAELRNISESQFNGSRPLFITCSLTAWNFTVGDVVGMVGQLGEKFEIVRPDEQFKMINMMNNGNRFNGTSSNEA